MDIAALRGLTRNEIIDGEWAAALADVPSLHRENVCLLKGGGLQPSRLAQYHQPGGGHWPAHEFIQGTELDRANAECRDKHRIAVWTQFELSGVGVAALAARLRHELEHARQFEAADLAFELDDLVNQVVRAKAGGSIDCPEYGFFYNTKPIELDANAAASIHVRSRWPDYIDALLGDPAHAALVRSHSSPESPGTLVRRMIAFLYQHEQVTRQVATPHAPDPASYLDTFHRGTGSIWRALEGAQ